MHLNFLQRVQSPLKSDLRCSLVSFLATSTQLFCALKWLDGPVLVLCLLESAERTSSVNTVFTSYAIRTPLPVQYFMQVLCTGSFLWPCNPCDHIYYTSYHNPQFYISYIFVFFQGCVSSVKQNVFVSREALT